MSPFWSAFVIVISVAMMIACLWLLFANAKGVPGQTGEHVWDDDLREYNNPLPRWWLNLFVLTVLFAAGYLAFYPGLGNLSGRLGWTSRGQMEADLARITASRHAAFKALDGKSIPELAQDPAALSLGRAVFMANCAGCHGADARGAIGFPNLTDGDWKFGGTPEAIVASISHGRTAVMPPLNGTLSAQELQDLIDFVPFWSDDTLPVRKREAGLKQFAARCSGCHGADGRGLTALGSPNLTDDIWLYGSGREKVRQAILFGRSGQMPAHEQLLDADEIRVVAAWVYGQSTHDGAAR